MCRTASTAAGRSLPGSPSLAGRGAARSVSTVRVDGLRALDTENQTYHVRFRCVHFVVLPSQRLRLWKMTPYADGQLHLEVKPTETWPIQRTMPIPRHSSSVSNRRTLLSGSKYCRVHKRERLGCAGTPQGKELTSFGTAG